MVINHKPYEHFSFYICWQWLCEGWVKLHVEKYCSVQSLSVYLDLVCLIVILSVDAAAFFGFYSIHFLVSACTWTTANVKFIKRQLHSNIIIFWSLKPYNMLTLNRHARILKYDCHLAEAVTSTFTMHKHSHIPSLNKNVQ